MPTTAPNKLMTAESPLAALLSPITTQEFFREYYGQKPFLRSDPSAAAWPVFTFNDMVARVQCLELEYGPGYTLARNGQWLDSVFQKSLVRNSNWLSGVLEGNWTLIVKSIDQQFFPLHRLGWELTDCLKAQINVNCYYTCAGSTGFGFHRDPYDVFVWQQKGSKSWKVLNQLEDDLENPAIETILEPGQLLYIPQNCLHAAEAVTGEDSLHLTIGFPSRYAQAKKILQDHISRWMDAEMTDGLADLATPDQVPDEQTCISRDEALLAEEAFRSRLSRTVKGDTNLHDVLNKFRRQISTDDVIRYLADSDACTALTLTEPVQIEPDNNKAGIVLRPRTGNLVFKEEFRDSLQLISQQQTFQMNDLPLEESTSAALCRVLMGAGLLRPDQA